MLKCWRHEPSAGKSSIREYNQPKLKMYAADSTVGGAEPSASFVTEVRGIRHGAAGLSVCLLWTHLVHHFPNIPLRDYGREMNILCY